MPPLPAVPNVLKHTDSYLLGSATRSADTIMHWTYSGSAPSAANCASLAAAWQTEYAAQLKFLMNDNNALETTTFLDLASNTGHQGQSSSPVTGTLTGAVLPASVCVVVQHQIARRYRGGKPRTYFPWGDGGKQNGVDSWAGSFITLITTNFAAAVAAFVGSVAGATTITALASVSYYQGFTVVTSPTTGRSRNVPKLRSGGPVVDAVVNNVPNTKYGTQRRRLRT